MITPKQFLELELKAGISPTNPEFVELARQTVNQILEYKDLSTIDYGSGTGVYSYELSKAGFKVVAQDVWKSHRDFMKDTNPDLKVIAKPIKSDLMLFIEVAEHMTDIEIKAAIKTIDPKIILFSSTSEKTENDQDWGHINIKSQRGWVVLWENMGYKIINSLQLPTPWTILLEKI